MSEVPLFDWGSGDAPPPPPSKRTFDEAADPPDESNVQRRFIMEEYTADAEEDQWNPVSFEQSTTTRDFDEEKCWGCLYGSLVESKEKYPAHYGLFDILAKNYGRMANPELFESMHEYHEFYIRQPALRDGQQCLPWPVATIKEHCLLHMNDPAIELGEQLKEAKAIKRFLLDKVTIRNARGEVKHDLKVINQVLAVSKSIREIHNAKPEKCLFHDRTLKIGIDD